MLVLSRRPGEKIVFPSLGIAVEVLRVAGNTVRIGIRAPRSVSALRDELLAGGGAAAGAEPAAEADHRLRGRLNAATMAMYLAQRQLELGDAALADRTIRGALDRLQSLEDEMRDEAGPRPGRIRALLVEDNVNECALLADYLRLNGIEVDAAGDGRAALDYLSTHEGVDVVLLDMHLPVYDGPATLAEIRDDPRYRGVKVFGVSGSRADDFGIATGAGGIEGWFTKPLNPPRIVEALRDSIGFN